MWGNSGVMTSRHGHFVGYDLADKGLDFRTIRMASKRSQFVKFSRPVVVEFLSYSRRSAFRGPSIQMTLVDEGLTDKRAVVKPADILAYDLVQGAHVTWSYIMDRSVPEPPTAVLLHGILGSRKNWGTFSRRLAKEFPKWQFLLVDLRCHGDSASIKRKGPHTVAAAALDVLKLLGQLKLTPRVVVGHSFGGKVALSMVEQAAKPLARPVRVCHLIPNIGLGSRCHPWKSSSWWRWR